MRTKLLQLLSIINHISVHGDDVARMYQAQQILVGMLTPPATQQPQKEADHGGHLHNPDLPDRS